MKDYLTTRDAAHVLGVSRSTLMGWVWTGKIRATRFGRYWVMHRDDVEAKRLELAA